MVRTMIPASGMMMADRRSAGEVETPNPLARLIQILRQNDDLLGRLETQARRLSRAWDYADDPKSNPTLGTALVEHAQRGYENLLAVLRANRTEALTILGGRGHADAS
jgi:hypothetical protein